MRPVIRGAYVFAMKALALSTVWILLIIAVGCGGGANDSETATAKTEQTTATEARVSPAAESEETSSAVSTDPPAVESRGIPTAEAEGRLASLLDAIPATPETRAWVRFNDYSRARNVHGITLPGNDASNDELLDYMGLILDKGMATGPWISGTTEYATRQIENREHVGFDIRDIEQSVQAGYLPNVLEAVRGRFDPDATERALDHCTECPDADREEHSGVACYSWGADLSEDLKKKFQPPAFDYLGRGGRIAVVDSYVFRTLDTERMRSLIEAYLGQGDPLADDADLALAASHLDDFDVYSGLLMGDVESLSISPVLPSCDYCSVEEYEELRATALKTAIDKYQTLGTGVGFDEDGLFVGLIFIYGDERGAETNVQVFEERLATEDSQRYHQHWAEHFPEAEVWSDGRALIAKLRTEDPRIWQQMVLSSDTLLWHR